MCAAQLTLRTCTCLPPHVCAVGSRQDHSPAAAAAPAAAADWRTTGAHRGACLRRQADTYCRKSIRLVECMNQFLQS